MDESPSVQVVRRLLASLHVLSPVHEEIFGLAVALLGDMQSWTCLEGRRERCSRKLQCVNMVVVSCGSEKALEELARQAECGECSGYADVL